MPHSTTHHKVVHKTKAKVVHKHYHAPHSTSAALKFIGDHLNDITAASMASGVPVGVIVAQGGLESGWGKHVVDNAYFGVKGHAPGGHATNFTTHEVVGGKTITIKDNFRAYTSFADAAMDYAMMLRRNPRFAMAFRHKDAMGFASQIGKYATDPLYVKKLHSIITQQKLSKFDRP